MFDDFHRPSLAASRPHGEPIRAVALASSPTSRAAEAKLNDFLDGRPSPARALARSVTDDKLSDFLGSKPTATATAVLASAVSIPARSAVGIASSGSAATDAKLAQFPGGTPGSPTASRHLQPTAAPGSPTADAKLADFREGRATTSGPIGSPDARPAATNSGLGALDSSSRVDVRRAFERRDADADGKLSMTEVTAALTDLRLDVEPARLRKAFIDLDTDQDFKIRAHEFAQLVSQLKPASNPTSAVSLPSGGGLLPSGGPLPSGEPLPSGVPLPSGGSLPSGAGWRDALPEWTACTRDFLVGKVDLAPDFTLEFELMLDHEPTSDWGSLLRISSTSADRGAYGDRLLTVLTHPGSHRLHVVCGTPRDPDASCDTAKVLTPGVAHTLKIVVAGASCIVLVDGRRAASKTGLSDRTRQPAARVLATDGFGVAARARLRKLSVQSVEATQPLQTLLGSAGSESAAAASPASDSSPASTFVELTTGLAAWRQTRSHGSFPAGKAPITAPHAAWFRPAPREGAWLGCSSAWPVGEVTFELEFAVTTPEAAHFALAYAVDNTLQRASLNGRPLDTGRAQGCRSCGGEATIWAPEGQGLFVRGVNVLSLTMANSGTTANPMGIYATGRAVTGFSFDHTDALAARQWAQQNGYLAGGGGLSFAGNYETKGLYAYKAGRCAKMAFFGIGGTAAQMSALPSSADQHRPHWGRGSHKPESPLVGSSGGVLPAAPLLAETRRAFAEFDTNRSGQLDFRELRQALAKLGLSSDSSTVLTTMRSFDVDASGTLSFPEFEKLVTLIARPRKAAATVATVAPSPAETRRAFSEFDSNRSGQLDFRELRQALAKLGLPSDTTTVLNAMRSFDTDASGTLSFPEFEKLVALIARPTNPQQAVPAATFTPSPAETRRVFGEFDLNRSGQLDFRELRQALAKLGLPSDSTSVLNAMRSFDADASGTLSFPEFEKLVALIGGKGARYPTIRPQNDMHVQPATPASTSTVSGTRRAALARLEPLLCSALDATVVEQPAEHDVLRFFARNVASLAYGGDAAIAAQEQRLGRSLDGAHVDDYLRRVQRTLESAIQEAVASCVAEMAVEQGEAADRGAVGALLSSSGLGAAKTDARVRIIPWLEKIVERTSRRESEEERRRREADDARRKAEAAARADEVEMARRRAGELASSRLIFDEAGGINLARDFNSDGAARLAATRRCRTALEGGTGAAPSVQEALVGGGHVARLANWAMGVNDPKLMREAAWVLALLHNEGGTTHRQAVANEPSAAAALVSALATPVGDAEGDRAAAAAAQALCELITASTAARDAALVRGVLSPLIERARRSPSPKPYTRLLTLLARGKPMVRLSLIAEALPALCQLTASVDAETATDACWAVASLLDGHDQHVQAVLAAAPELPRRLVEVLGRPDANAAAAVAARPPVVAPEVLRAFHRFDKNSSGALSRSEVRVALAALGLDTSRAEAAAVLRQFDADGSGTLSPAELSNLAARLGFGPAVDLITTGGERDSGMLTPAVRALSSICACGDALTQAVIDNAGLPALARLIDCPLPSVRKEALLALSNVAAGSAEQVCALLGAGVFAPLTKRMAEGEREFNKEAVWTLANATASGDTDTLLAIARTSRAVAELVRMVGDDDPKLVEVALDGLNNLLMAGAGSVVHSSVKRVFDRFDVNRSGRVSHAELGRALIDLGLDPSRKQAAAILRQYDADGDGTLSPPEFAALAARLGAPRGGTNPVSTQMHEADAERVLRAIEASRRRGDAADPLTEKTTRVLDLCRAGMDI